VEILGACFLSPSSCRREFDFAPTLIMELYCEFGTIAEFIRQNCRMKLEGFKENAPGGSDIEKKSLLK
jgi:hypothetical protein